MFWSLCVFFVFDEGGKTIVQLEEEKEILPSSSVHPLVWLLVPSGPLHFGGAGFGHLDGGLTLGVKQRSLQSS